MTSENDKIPEGIAISQVIRRMRGGSQAFLVQGEDGKFYVAKFTGNPQGNRTLINEWITHRLFQRVGISTPSMRLLTVKEDTNQKETLCFQTAGRSVPIQGTFHLGSECPVDPTRTAIFDFLPRSLLCKVVNITDLGTAFVLDKWLGQTDIRQAIFVRAPGISNGLKLRLYLIDHGMSFAGAQWEVADSARLGLYVDHSVYSILDMRAICQAALSRIENFSENDLYDTAGELPSCWLAEFDYDALAKLFACLDLRRKRLASVISRQLDAIQCDLASRSVHQIQFSAADVLTAQQPIVNAPLIPATS